MRKDAALQPPEEFHLAGVLLVVSSVMLGVVLSLAILFTEQDRRVGSEKAASPQTGSVSAPAAAVAPSPTAALVAVAQPSATPTAAPVTPTTAPANPSPASPTQAAATGDPVAGAAAFAATCGVCHPDGKAGVGPDIRGLPADKIASTVRSGNGAMPPFGQSAISDRQLQDIIAYLRAGS